jgi:hypothetical protein
MNTRPATERTACAASGPSTAPGAGNGPVIVLSYLHSGAYFVQQALAAGTDLVCTQSTGIVATCATVAETWQRLENRTGRPLSPLAAASVRELVNAQLITVLSTAAGSRWCELAIASPDAAASFGEVIPATRFVCVHRSAAPVIRVGAQAGLWGLGGQIPLSYIMSYPGNSVAAIATYWAEAAQALLAFEAAHPEVSYRVRYEDVAAHPEDALATVRSSLSLRPGRSGHSGFPAPSGPEPDAPSAASDVPFEKIPRPVREAIDRLHAELGYPPLAPDRRG